MNSSSSCMNAEQEQICEESGKFELRNCVITKIRIKREFISEAVDRMHPWRPRRNFKPINSQNSLVGIKAFITPQVNLFCILQQNLEENNLIYLPLSFTTGDR